VRLTEPHHRHLYGIALALCHDADQAADLTQETLIHAFAAFDRFRPGASMRPWLRSILRHLFLDTFKTGRSRHEVAESDIAAAEGSSLTEIPDERPDPLAELERAELQQWVQQEIAALSPAHRQVLTLCVVHGLGFAEAAELAGIPVGTVASRLGRARAELRERLLRRTSLTPGGEAYRDAQVSGDADDGLGRRSVATVGVSTGGVGQSGEMSAKVEKTPR
jgi:RNA polymerase sigma-70 factor, ECF subfamily